MKHILAIDIGNTSVACGLFRGRRLVKRWRMRTDECRDMRALARRIRSSIGTRLSLEGVCIVSVVPRLNAIFRRVCKSEFGNDPLFATHKTIPMLIKGYDKKQLGADRLVAAFAAWQLWRKPVIAIDAGTAITIDLVNARGEFEGGVIVPGLAAAAASLHAMTAKLPLVKPRVAVRTIGRTTREAINAGIVRGYGGLVERIVGGIARESKSRPLVVVTGGDAQLIRDACSKKYVLDEDLVLKGLVMLADNAVKP